MVLTQAHVTDSIG